MRNEKSSLLQPLANLRCVLQTYEVIIYDCSCLIKCLMNQIQVIIHEKVENGQRRDQNLKYHYTIIFPRIK